MLRGAAEPWSPERAQSLGRRSGSLDRHGGSAGIIANPMAHQENPEDSDEPRGSSVGQMQNLMNACDDLGRAMESLVVSVVYDSDENED